MEKKIDFPKDSDGKFLFQYIFKLTYETLQLCSAVFYIAFDSWTLVFYIGTKYLTLSILKEMKNGEKVIIHQVTTDLMDVVIPYDVIQHGRDANPDSFGERIYFKQIKNVTVTYLSNSNGKESHIKLVHLKEVSEIDKSSFMAQYYKRVSLLVSQTIGLLLLS